MADAAAELEEGGMVRTLKDLFAGAAGGIAQVLLGKFGFLISADNIASSVKFESGRVTCREWGMPCALSFALQVAGWSIA